jgi:hypothetical protein
MLTHLGASLLAQGAAGAEPRNAWDVLRHDVIPAGAAYLVFIGILISYRRATRRVYARGHALEATRRAGRGKAPPPVAVAGWSDLLRYLGEMVAGGYAFFLAIVVVFYFVLGGEDVTFIRQALVEGSLLAFALVLPAFLVLSWLEELLKRRGKGP